MASKSGYKCTLCSKAWIRETTTIEHIKKVHGKNEVQPGDIQKVFIVPKTTKPKDDVPGKFGVGAPTKMFKPPTRQINKNQNNDDSRINANSNSTDRNDAPSLTREMMMKIKQEPKESPFKLSIPLPSIPKMKVPIVNSGDSKINSKENNVRLTDASTMVDSIQYLKREPLKATNSQSNFNSASSSRMKSAGTESDNNSILGLMSQNGKEIRPNGAQDLCSENGIHLKANKKKPSAVKRDIDASLRPSAAATKKAHRTKQVEIIKKSQNKSKFSYFEGLKMGDMTFGDSIALIPMSSKTVKTDVTGPSESQHTENEFNGIEQVLLSPSTTEADHPQSSSSSSSVQISNKPRKRRKSRLHCWDDNCAPCSIIENCNTCLSCLNKQLRQKCELRQCPNLNAKLIKKVRNHEVLNQLISLGNSPDGEKEERTGEKQEHTGEKQEHTGEKEEHTGEKEEHTGEKEEHTGEKEEHIGEKEEHIGEKEEHIGEKEEHTGDNENTRNEEGTNESKEVYDLDEKSDDLKKKIVESILDEVLNSITKSLKKWEKRVPIAKPKIYACNKCGILYKQFKSKQTHEKKCKGILKVKIAFLVCEVCRRTLSDKRSYRRHMNTFHKKTEKDIQCEQCNMNFSSKSKLKNHMANIHAKKNPNLEEIKLCPVEGCGFTHKKEAFLKRHLTKEHNNKIKINCQICPFKCLSQAGLNRHLRTVHIVTTTEMIDLDGDDERMSNEENSDMDESCAKSSSDENDLSPKIENSIEFPNPIHDINTEFDLPSFVNDECDIDDFDILSDQGIDLDKPLNVFMNSESVKSTHEEAINFIDF